MARTQAPDYDARREEIVGAAAALFAKRGYGAASIAELAERVGASKSLIYHYYAAKDDILYDVMISHVLALERAAEAALAASTSPAERLRALARRFMALYVGAADRHKVLLNDLDHLPKARRAEIVAVQRGLVAVVRDLLVAIEPRLARPDARARAAAMLFFGAINWTHTWFDAKGAIPAAALADMAVDITLGGVSATAG